MSEAKTTSCNWDQPVPFNQNIRRFIARSRKGQTLYSNCEGAYGRRVFKKEEENSLKDYIYNTVYYKGDGNFRLSQEGDSNGENVDSIQRKIAAVSNEFGFRGETHVTVVWVYLFDFESERELSFPVFKIYKAKSREDAVFLTLDLTLHDCWDSYLENGSFPDAFVCVPRHGQYHFDEEVQKLVLEFVTTRKARKEVSQAFSFTYSRTFRDRTFSSFCHTVVYPLIIKIKKFGDSVMAKIKNILKGFQDFWNAHRDGIMRGVIFVIYVLIDVLQQNLSGIFTKSGNLKCLKKISDAGLMLLDVRDSKMMLNEKFLTLIGSLTSDSQLSTDQLKLLGEEAENKDLAELISLWKEPKKNWREILKIFCSLYIRAQPLLMIAITNLFCNPTVLMVLTVLFHLAKIFEKSAFLNPPEECQSTPSTSEKHYNVLAHAQSSCQIAALPHSPNNAMVSKSVDAVEKPPRLSNSSAEAFGDEKKVQLISVEKFLGDFGDLEMVSAGDIEKRAQLTDTASLPRPAFSHVEDVDGQRIFFTHNLSIPKLASHIHHLLGIDFSLTRENNFIFSVTASSGEIVGTLYFPLDFTAIALFPIKNLARKEAKEMKILED